jgi:tRNA modification GTPase
VLYVVDATAAEPLPPAGLEDLPSDVPVTWVVNKIDLLGTDPRVEIEAGVTRLFVSARSGAGMDLIRDHLQSVAGYRAVEAGAFSARRRHLDALGRARVLVRNAADTLYTARAIELFAEDLRLAQRCLSDITGEFTSEDLLGEIFGSFCIGK